MRYILAILALSDGLLVFLKKGGWLAVIVGSIGAALGYILTYALLDSKMHTMQDGWVVRAADPIRYWFLVVLLSLGYLLVLWMPWLGDS